MFSIGLILKVLFRIVSAYEDKILKYNKHYTPAVVTPMINKYGDTTFKSFVRMILDDPGCPDMSRCHLDVHWQPYYANCCFCRVHYKYFVRMEELDTDVNFIGKMANVDFNAKIG